MIGVIGSGAAGEVYKVEHAITRRVEAMKVLLRERVEVAEQTQRFLREIQLQASLSHPNIATVLNALRAGGHLVMVMELVEGQTLDRILAAGRLPLRQGAGYILQALDALAYAHEHGVTHRDIKPSNMLVTAEGVLKLTDFGLARTMDDPRLTQTGAVVGSLHYISPEQVQSDPNVDFRTDIYSLGAVLYEVVTGVKPFPIDNSFALMLAHVQGTPQPPHLREPGVPEAVSRVVMRAMAKRPEERYASAREFRGALEEALERLPAPAAAPASDSAAAKPQPLPRARRLSMAALAAASMLAGFVAVAGVRGWLDWFNTPRETLALVKPPAPAVPATDERESPPREVTSVVVSAPAPAAPAKSRPDPAAANTAGVSAAGAAGPSGVAPVTLPPLPDPKAAPSAATPVDRLLPVLPPGLPRPIGAVPPGLGASVLAFSPNGQWLAVGGRSGAIEVWQIRPPRRAATLSAHAAPVSAVSFTPDSAALVSGSADGAIKVWNLRERIESKTFGQGSPVLSLAVSPDARWVAFGTADRRVRLWSLIEKGVVEDLRDVRREPRALAFHPSGAVLAMAAPDNSVRLWRMTAGYPLTRYSGLDRGASRVLFSPDGQYLAVAGDNQVRILDAQNGRSLHLANPPPQLMAMCFLPGGHCVALLRTAEGGQVWDVWQGEALRHGRRDRAFSLAAFRPDGRELAVIGDNAVIAVWGELPAPVRPRLLPRSVR